MKLVTRSILLTAALALSLASCSSKEPGNASPSTAAKSSPSETNSSAPGTSGSPTSSLDSCSLLSAADLSTFGSFGEPERSTEGGARTCAYSFKSTSASDGAFTIGVGIRDQQGLADANDAGGGITPGQVNGRKAAQIPIPPYACILALELGDHARADVTVNHVTTKQTQPSCEVASKVADIVEPKLPKG
ncbi:DUF3558 family protein [Amycolatopsis sp. cg5]|uniref:DUF3558 family protein n=1 Tax=Amycolatopsis sp. cg5 TaxID=3238802 RepID=UPI00352573BF